MLKCDALALAWQEPAVVICECRRGYTVCSISSIFKRPKSLHFSLNDTIERCSLLNSLVTIGYERVDQVEQRGHFAVRGDILDIYPCK